MARLSAQSKLLYYPPPPSVCAKIATYFNAPDHYRMCDTSAGNGTAVKQIADTIGQKAELWGIELSYIRAANANKILDKVLPTSFYNVRWGKGTTSIIFNNPPYDYSDYVDGGRKVRHEQLFTRRSTNHLVVGGHQVAILPRAMLSDSKLVRHMLGWYDNLFIWKFTEEDGYQDFKQVVIFLIGKRKKYQSVTSEQARSIEALSDASKTSLYDLQPGQAQFIIPPTPSANRFEAALLSPRILINRAAQSYPDPSMHLKVLPPGAPMQPIVPEKIGHISMEISSGEVGSLMIGDTLTKGSVHKSLVEITREEEDDGTIDITAREQMLTRITTINQNGDVTITDDREEVGEFITENAKEGWRFVQAFAPSIGKVGTSLYGCACLTIYN